MNFTQYMLDFSPSVRGLIGVVVMVAFSLAMVFVFHSRVVNLDYVQVRPEPAEDGEQAADDAEPELEWQPKMEGGRKVSESLYLGGVVRALCGTAFVFLVAFTLSNLWSTSGDARDAVQYESAALVQAYLLTGTIPADAGRDDVRAALRDYWKSTVDEQWPLMRLGDKDNALQTFSTASLRLASATSKAQQAGADKSPNWPNLEAAISTMTQNGSTRILRSPGPEIVGILGVIMLLGIANLVVTSIFQPARLGPSLVLIGVMATITAFLFFLVVEVSNPYLGGAAIQPPPFNVSMIP